MTFSIRRSIVRSALFSAVLLSGIGGTAFGASLADDEAKPVVTLEVNATAPIAEASTASVAIEAPVEIGTACTIERNADGSLTSTGCE